MQTTQRSRTKVIQVIVHTIAWAMMFCSPLFFSQGEGNSISWARYLGFCASPLAFMLVFYLNYFVLIDRLLFRKRLGTFVLINLLLIILLAVGLHGWHEFHRTYVMGIPPSSRPRARTQFYLFFMLRDAVTMLLVTGLSVAIKMTGRWYRVEREKQEIEKERTQAELQNLKSQLNPHFLFNTLNTLYGLMLTDVSRAETAFMQFMDLTKYMYTNAEKDKVPLRAEIDYIRQYIELQKNRMNDRTHVHFSVEKRNERPDAAIAPMILITFVENALKYGVSSHVRSDIFIGLALDGDWLHFTTRNPVVVRPSAEKSGFGIVNCRKRLDLLYPGRYTLEIREQADEYRVTLDLKLH